MALHLTAQETEAATLDPSVQEPGGHIGIGEPSLPVPQLKGGNILTRMIPLHVNVGDAHWVYHCWVEGSLRDPCPPMHHINLGMKLSCPLCPITFLTLMPSNNMASRHITLGFQTQCKEYYTHMYIKKNCYSETLMYKRNHVVNHF